jgi:hypothetical protein
MALRSGNLVERPELLQLTTLILARRSQRRSAWAHDQFEHLATINVVGATPTTHVDGGFNLDSGSNNSQINNVGIDFIRGKDSECHLSGRGRFGDPQCLTKSGGYPFTESVLRYTVDYRS